jgi:hypothetical protein
MFSHEISTILWRPPAGNEPFQVISGAEGFFDDQHNKHGSGVTALALHSIMETGPFPQLMILKALDSNNKGSSFTVSCALSYAIQHHAAVINASLGYYGTASVVDPVFRYYIDLCNQAHPAPIPIFVAAGNALGDHTSDKICYVTNSNLLNDERSFYPACFTPDFGNVVSVTGLRNLQTACFYQNYSDEYVSLGVLNTQLDNQWCCSFYVPFFDRTYRGYEGSSFATPVACGRFTRLLLNGQTSGVADFLNRLTLTSTLMPKATKNGKYINYDGNDVLKWQ